MLYPFIPPYLHYYLSLIKQKLKRQRWDTILSKNKDLKNKYSGKRCFIIGTAPSIMDFDLTLLKEEPIFVINEFFYHPEIDLIINSYPENKHIVLPPTHATINEDMAVSGLKEIQEKISNKVNLFFGLDDYHHNYHYLINKEGLFGSFEIRYYLSGIQTNLGWYPFSEKHWDLTRNIWSSAVGSIYTMIIALYMNFDEIYLLGIDHSYLSYKDPASYRFYNENISLSKKISDEIKNNMNAKNKTQNTIILEGTHYAFEQYALILKYAKTKIYNLSPKSILDIYPRRDFNEILKPI